MGEENLNNINRRQTYISFTAKGRTINVHLANGKYVYGTVERCIGSFADVKVNGKTILVNSNHKQVR